MDEARNNKVFSDNLMYYLKRKGVTQKEAAVYCGVSTGTFNDWVKGRAFPRIEKVQRLAEYFNVEKSDLIEERSYNNQHFLMKELNNISEELTSDPEAIEIYQSIKKLSPANREIVKSLLNSLNKGVK